MILVLVSYPLSPILKLSHFPSPQNHSVLIVGTISLPVWAESGLMPFQILSLAGSSISVGSRFACWVRTSVRPLQRRLTEGLQEVQKENRDGIRPTQRPSDYDTQRCQVATRPLHKKGSQNRSFHDVTVFHLAQS